ncbi:MAG: hypothetical protein O7E52_08565 [Candidatus Poribacteria bacterium]|nr:hypothetical protein [Candidatus Poribacteria bacterium]
MSIAEISGHYSVAGMALSIQIHGDTLSLASDESLNVMAID